MSGANSESLADLGAGATAVVAELEFDELDCVRLMELGFIPGATVSCQRLVPLGDIAVYQVEGSQIALRRETASQIKIRSAAHRGAADADRT